MKKIRLGNDIQFTWTVEGLSDASGSKTVQLIDQFGHIEEIEYNINGDVITGTFYGKDQKHSGTYRLCLVVNEGLKDMATLDHVKAFLLVDVSDFGIMTGRDDDTVETVALNLHGSLRVGGDDEGGGSGGITVEVDPTVPAWAKEPTKPVYTAAEVGAMPADAQVVTDVRKKVVTTSERDVTLEPNKYYIFGECEELTISVGEPTTNGLLNEYEFEFDSGDVATELNLPEQLLNYTEFTVLPNTHYIISIVGNTATVLGSNNYYPSTEDWIKDFYNRAITSVVVPDGVNIITSYTFYNCLNLNHVTLPDGITDIGQYAFASCKNLTEIHLGEGLSFIRDRAFDSCTNLNTVELPDGLTSIGSYAFNACSNLEHIDIPDSVYTLGSTVFNACSKLTHINWPANCLSTGTSVFSGSGLIDIDIPSGVTVLSTSNFASCRNLMSVNIPDSVVTIGATVFQNCTNLRSIVLPENVVTVGANCFQSCTSLVDVTVHDSITTVTAGTSFSGIGAYGVFKILGTNRVMPFVTLPATTNVYVEDTMVNAYKAASGWSGIASRIFPLSDLD